jgi:hypothetical protein
MAAYPTANSASATARIGYESGTPTTWVTAKVVVTPPARTVIGADAETVKKTRCAVPSLLRASPVDWIVWWAKSIIPFPINGRQLDTGDRMDAR